ncbi:hypothetical protein BVRB_027790 [Beta vulgaris subsp. vulgaris]|uniref:Uncharacterized protein n=1 Tax=Beta vulgaris subsp. vulgaris TaxID=3555 RepID=A0A0J8AY94_BETVV|nr:hypothetical protein BVRB_027790 [Beta vulgaris subsp. vulgaris]
MRLTHCCKRRYVCLSLVWARIRCRKPSEILGSSFSQPGLSRPGFDNERLEGALSITSSSSSESNLKRDQPPSNIVKQRTCPGSGQTIAVCFSRTRFPVIETLAVAFWQLVLAFGR